MDISGDLVTAAVQVLERRHVVWVLEKADIEHQVGIYGEAVFEAEGGDGDTQAGPRILCVGEMYRVAQLYGGHLAGVENAVREGSCLLKKLALRLDRFD